MFPSPMILAAKCAKSGAAKLSLGGPKVKLNAVLRAKTNTYYFVLYCLVKVQ